MGLEIKNTVHSPLLEKYLMELAISASGDRPILDLACGGGRNGRYLAEQGLPVCFADRNREALATIESELVSSDLRQPPTYWPVDFEQPDSTPLQGKHFGGILVFRYLHRPLLPAIADALVPGGILVYETFTVEHAAFGKPSNPDFLLQPGELEERFPHWEYLHRFEGIAQSETGGRQQAIAQLVARKPA